MRVKASNIRGNIDEGVLATALRDVQRKRCSLEKVTWQGLNHCGLSRGLGDEARRVFLTMAKRLESVHTPSDVHCLRVSGRKDALDVVLLLTKY